MFLRAFFVFFLLCTARGMCAEIFNEKTDPISRIGVIFAFPDCTAGDEFAPWFVNSKKSTEGGRVYRSGDYFGKYLVVSSVWPNKVSASLTSCHMILRYKVDLILIIGGCYSRSESRRFGDIVLADGYMNYDLDFRPLFTQFEVPCMNRVIFPTKDGYLAMAKKQGVEFMHTHKQDIEELLKRYGYIKSTTEGEQSVVRGMIATGESFAMSKHYFMSLQSAYPSIQGTDSAGGAIAQTCYGYSVPCFGVHILMPHPLESSCDQWRGFQESMMRLYTDTFVKDFIQEICLIY